MERVSNFRMKPFENGWAKRQGYGNTYGISYLHLYEDDLKTMFQVGVINNSNKFSAGKMRENLLDIYPDRVSIPGEIEIKQFIGKLSQQYKKKRVVIMHLQLLNLPEDVKQGILLHHGLEL